MVSSPPGRGWGWVGFRSSTQPTRSGDRTNLYFGFRSCAAAAADELEAAAADELE